MSLVYNGTTIDNVVFNNTNLDAVVYNGVTVFEKLGATKLYVKKITSTVYQSSTSYANCKFLGLTVSAKDDVDATITYSGITKTVSAGLNGYIVYGQFGANDDDGSADEGIIEINNALTISIYSFSDSKNTTKRCECIEDLITLGNVVHIGNYLFYNNQNIRDVFIPSTVKSIGQFAFQNSSITSLHIGSNLESINTESSYASFAGCGNLNYITGSSNVYTSTNNCLMQGTKLLVGSNNSIIPNNTTEIGNYAFNERSGFGGDLNLLNITKIGFRAFSGTNITSVRLNIDALTGSNYVFDNCSNLTQAIVNSGTSTSLPSGTFQNCHNLSSLTLPNNLTIYRQYTFENCYNLTTFPFISSVTQIEAYAFNGCSGLTSITLPNVTTIGISAFKGCSNALLQNMPSTVTKIETSAFEGIKGFNNVTFSYAGLLIYQKAFANVIQPNSGTFTTTLLNWTYGTTSSADTNTLTLNSGSEIRNYLCSDTYWTYYFKSVS